VNGLICSICSAGLHFLKLEWFKKSTQKIGALQQHQAGKTSQQEHKS
jgi:hypothetical protein